MVVPFLRRSLFFRALVLTAGVFSFLLWLYIVMRIVFNHVNVMTPFINRVPSISFWVLGAFSFGVAFLCMFLYLWIWSRFGRSYMVPQSYDEREP